MFAFIIKYVKWLIFPHILRSLIRVKFPKSLIASNVNIICRSLAKIRLKEGVFIGANCVIHIIDNDNEDYAFFSVGKDTYIGENNNIRAAGGKIEIGSNCLLAQNISLISSNHLYSELSTNISSQGWDKQKRDILIGNNVWIGANVVILPGVTIGSGAIVGAGSIVTKDVSEKAVLIGTPANILKYRT